MDVGTVILDAVAPAVEKIGKFFTDLSDKFKNLSPETQKTILAFVGIVAAIGPVIAVLGTLLTLAPAIGAAFTLMMGPVGLVIAGLTAIAFVIYKNHYLLSYVYTAIDLMKKYLFEKQIFYSNFATES